MTFSLSALDRATGMFGIAVASSSIAVGNRCPWARAGVGIRVDENAILGPALDAAVGRSIRFLDIRQANLNVWIICITAKFSIEAVRTVDSEFVSVVGKTLYQP